MPLREKVKMTDVTGGNSIAHGRVIRFSRYGVKGDVILPSSPVSLRINKRNGKAEMYGSPRGGVVTAHYQIVRQAMLEPLAEGEDPQPRLAQTYQRYYFRGKRGGRGSL